MKKLILTITAVALLVVGSAKFTSANAATVLSNISTFSKIEVRGNVELVVATGDKNKVELNNSYYAENAMVQAENGVLRISSYNVTKLVVYVTAADLHAITAYDNASVRSDKRLSLIDFEVTLNNKATATLTLDNFVANVTVNDQAKATLTGNVTEYSLNYSQSSVVNRIGLVAENSTETLAVPFKAAAKQVSEITE